MNKQSTITSGSNCLSRGAPVLGRSDVGRSGRAGGGRGKGRFHLHRPETCAEVPGLSFLLALLIAVVSSARAQNGLQDFLFTVGTTLQDSNGRHWAFIVWDTTQSGLVAGKHYAIYQKTGDVASASLYVRKAIVARQTDPRVISALLQRSVNLGENLVELDSGMTTLFQRMTNALSLPLPEKVSAIIRGSSGQPAYEANLRLLARLHPGLALCLGAGHAEIIAGPTNLATFEIREFDSAKQEELGVVGRVTVAAGAPVVLPAPGVPVQVPEANPRGHLNAKLRWATPDALRRLSLLNNGFNVWRIHRVFAEASGYTNAPPSADLLRAIAVTNSLVHLVNRAPVLKTKDFDVFSVSDFSTGYGDPTTYFCVDDNDEFAPGGVPFNNGDQFYFFVSARDLLGRDGFMSAGALVTICSRLAPHAPKGVRVENDYSYSNGVPSQSLRVTWLQNSNTVGDTALNYYVYRWNSATQIVALESLPLANRIAGPIPHVPGGSNLTYLDSGAGAPSSASANQTFWYTVRAGDDGACGENLSPNSGPAFGVLRGRVGPLAPGGGIQINCASAVTGTGSSTFVTEPGLDPALAYYRAQCQRANPFLQWAEFSVVARCPAETFSTVFTPQRVDFDPQTGTASFDYSLPRGLWASSCSLAPIITITCTAALGNNQVSATVSNQFQAWPATTQRRVDSFTAGVVVTPTLSGSQPIPATPAHLQPPLVGPGSSVSIRAVEPYSGSGRIQASSDLLRWTDVATVPLLQHVFFFDDPAVLGAPYRFYRVLPTDFSAPQPCPHFPYPPGDGNAATNAGVAVQVCFTPGTAEYRVYRSVDDGPLTLMAQDEVTNANGCVTRVDDTLPAVGADVRYFGQLFDRHGNASPLARLGAPLFVWREPPCPLLSPIQAVWSNGASKMVLQWFCPPGGVERFKIYLETGQGQAPQTVSPSTSPSQANSLIARTVFLDSHVRKALFSGVYDTERIGSSSLGNGPQFIAVIDATPDIKYTVQVKAVSHGIESGQCFAREFTWHPPSTAPQVPWPARALPSVNPNFDSRITASRLANNNVESWVGLFDTNAYPVGVRIGQARVPRCATFPTNVLVAGNNPMQYVFGSGTPAGAVLPVVLYRQQVANGTYPQVSGDTVQASPLIERIAYQSVTGCIESQNCSLKDPFIKLTDIGAFQPNDSYSLADMYLVDTQPVLAGARYRYLLMRFDPATYEPDQIIPAGEVEIPDQ